MSPSEVQPFPWQSLPAIAQASLAVRQRARDVWRRRVATEHLTALFTELFGAQLEAYGVTSERPCKGTLPSLGADLALVASDRRVQLSVQPALVSLLVGRVVDQAPSIDDASTLSDTLRGAWFAIVAEVCRRTARAEPFQPKSEVLDGPLWQIDFWVRIDQRTFLGRLGLGAQAEKGPAPLDLESQLPLTLPLVLAVVTATLREIRSLRLGDVLLYAEGKDPLGSGCSLCAPNSKKALAVRQTERGIAFLELTNLDTSAVTGNSPGRGMASKDEDDTLQDALLDADVEVRVELGSVTMPARQWLSLGPGDIVSSSIPLSSPVQLRVSGQLVAEGNLVSVDGKLGVELVKIVGS